LRIPNQSVGMRWMGILRLERSNIVANLVMRRVISQKPNLSGGFGGIFGERPETCYDRCDDDFLDCVSYYCRTLPGDLLHDVCHDICTQIFMDCLRDCDR